MARYAAPQINADWRVITIETDLEFLVRWERAQSIEPRSLDFAQVLGGTMRDDGLMDITVAVPKHLHENLTATLGEDAPSGLEEWMLDSASDILRDVEIEETFLKIPQGTEGAGETTVTVAWNIEDTVDCYEAVLAADGEVRNVKIERVKREGNLATLAVTLPHLLLDAAKREYSPDLDAPDFDTVVLDIIIRSIREAEPRDDHSGACKIVDDEIPF